MFAILTHAALAALYEVVAFFALLKLGGLTVVQTTVLSAFGVGLLFYAREAGQREHDLKNMGWPDVRAFFGAMLFFGWAGPNFLQWAVPAAVSAGLAVALYLGLR